MAIAPTAGAAGDSGGSQVTSQTITVPAGILGGDVVLIWAICVPISSTVATITASSTGTAPVAVTGGNITGTEPLPATVTGRLFTFTAAGATGSASSDVGKVITLTYSTSGFGAQALQGYSGASTSGPVDVIGGAFGGANTASVTCPVLSTGAADDWAVFLGGGAAEGGNLTIPAGSASRRADLSSTDVAAYISDSNASVGAAGTSIGGGTFTTASATNSILVALTVGLAAAGVGGTTASGAPEPPVIPPHPQFTRLLLEEAWQRADWQAQGFADLTVAYSSSASGIDTYNVTSPYNLNVQQQMRVLKPAAPNGNYPHAFLIMLPVDPNQDTTFGDSIGTAQSLGAHNIYNLTCIQPGYADVGGVTGPWYADNPINQGIYQETYTLLIVNWIRNNLATTGNEKIYLIGFSRSGLGGQALQFRHPDLFAATASWDSPFMMTDYDGTDPTNGSSIGGNPASVYGTSSNFRTKYQLSAAHLAIWQATGQYGINRLWIGGGPAFPADITAYDTALATAGIPHTYTFSNPGDTHAWHADWVAAALAAIIPSNYAEAPILPRIPHPLFTQLLEVAAYRSGGGAPPRNLTQSLTASAVASGTLQDRVGKNLGASAVVTGTVTRQVSRPLAAALIVTGALVRGFARALAAAGTAQGSMARQTGKLLTGSAGVTGTVNRQTARPLPSSLVVTGSAGRSLSRVLTAPAVLAGSAARAVARPFTSSVPVTGTLSRNAGRAFPGSAVVSASLTRATSRSMGAAFVVAASVSRNTGRALAAALAVATAVRRNPALLLTAPASAAVTLGRALSRSLGASATLAGSVLTGRAFTLTLAAAAVLTGSLSAIKVKLLTLAASLPLTGTLTRGAAKQLSAGAPLAGTLRRGTARTITGQAAATGSLSKGTGRTLSAPLATSGTLGRLITRPLTAGASLAATGVRSIRRALSAAVNLAAQLGTGGGGHAYALTFQAAAVLTSALTPVLQRIAIMFSAGAARLRWAAGAARQRWSAGSARND